VIISTNYAPFAREGGRESERERESEGDREIEGVKGRERECVRPDDVSWY